MQSKLKIGTLLLGDKAGLLDILEPVRTVLVSWLTTDETCLDLNCRDKWIRKI